MAKKPGEAARGSRTGRPIMVLFDLLGERWTLRILWELRNERLTFRELQSRCADVSPTVLNRRLKSLREFGLVDHEAGGYGHTDMGRSLAAQLMRLNGWANDWAASLQRSGQT